uniref:Uncharacterized protein n=1 Tax=Zeugodacus cucurbitae TaxID=28588 RepID=A0A0A1XPM5_ZEUCU
MKVVLALTAVLFVLLDNRVSVSAHRRLPHHTPQRPPHTHPADTYIPAIAGDLFTAIFNPSEFPAVSVGPITNAQGCINAHNSYALIAVAYAGKAIRRAVKITEGGLHITNVDQLREQFVENINRCSILGKSPERFDCYERVITDLFQEIATANQSHGYIFRPIILKALKRLDKKLARVSQRLQKCLARFPESATSTTTEPQTSSDTTTTVGVSSSEPPTSSDITTTIDVSSSEPQTSSDATTTVGVWNFL